MAQAGMSFRQIMAALTTGAGRKIRSIHTTGLLLASLQI
jgi:hypothetical protein